MQSAGLAELLGVQEPRFRWSPPSFSSAASEAIDLCAQVGMPLDRWQQIALEVMLGERADGKWSALEAAVIVARQNGKGGIIEARELAALFLFGGDDELVVHSAHLYPTAGEAFVRMKNIIDGSDFLTKRIKKVSNSHGDEGFELRSGARLLYKTRTAGGGRGFSGDLVVMDEAQEVTPRQIAALMPTMSARKNPQILYAGTVNATATYFRAIAERGRKGNQESLAYAEWSAPDDADSDDVQAWAQANPALGIRIPLDYIQAEFAALKDVALEEFRQERLSIWPEISAVGSVIPVADWDRCLDPQGVFAGVPTTVGVAVSPDRDWSAVGVACFRPDGSTYVELVKLAEGTDWLVPWLASPERLWEKPTLIVDQAGPAGTLLALFGAAGLKVRVTDYSAFKAACAGFVDGVKIGNIRHRGQAELTSAVVGVQEKKAGDSFVFARRSTTVIAPLEAVTLALWGLTPEPAKKEFFMQNLNDF